MNLETLMDYEATYRLQHAETYNLGLWQAAIVNHLALLMIEAAIECRTDGERIALSRLNVSNGGAP